MEEKLKEMSIPERILQGFERIADTHAAEQVEI